MTMVSHKENSCDIFVVYARPTENSSWYALKRNTGILVFLHTDGNQVVCLQIERVTLTVSLERATLYPFHLKV